MRLRAIEALRTRTRFTLQSITGKKNTCAALFTLTRWKMFGVYSSDPLLAPITKSVRNILIAISMSLNSDSTIGITLICFEIRCSDYCKLQIWNTKTLPKEKQPYAV